MRCKVSILRDRGVVIPEGKKILVLEGELGLFSHLHPVLGRLSKEAKVVDEKGLLLCPGLVDVELISISAEGFTLRGLEYHHTQKGLVEYAQEWYCRPSIKG